MSRVPIRQNATVIYIDLDQVMHTNTDTLKYPYISVCYSTFIAE